MKCWNRFAAVLVVVILVSPGQAQDFKGAATPEEAVKNLVGAAQAGNVEAVMGQLTKPAQDMLKAFQGQEDIRKSFAAALDEKFGKDPSERPQASLKDQLATLKSMDILEKTDRGKGVALLKIKSTSVHDGKERTKEEYLLAVKEGNTWKLAPLPPRIDPKEDPQKLIEKETEQARTFATRYREGTEKVTREVKEGKYKSRKDAMDAYFKTAFPGPSAPAKEAPKDKAGR